MCIRLSFAICLLMVAALFAPLSARGDDTMDFVLSGRFTDSSGKPVVGPVALQISFLHQNPGTPVLTVSQGFETVALQEGIFQVRVTLSASEYHKVFPDVSQAVWFQVTDTTHGLPAYTAQQVIMVYDGPQGPVIFLPDLRKSNTPKLAVGPVDMWAA